MRTGPPAPGRRSYSRPIHSAAFSIVCVASLLGCATTGETEGAEIGAPAGDAESERMLESWTADVRSEDVAVRAHAADLILFAPGARGAEALRGLLEDPEAPVRRRAVLAYGQLLGREAIPLLKHAATTDPDDEVRHLALAAFGSVKERSPAPPRTWMTADVVTSAPIGEPFQVAVRFGSSEAAPSVKVFVHPPDGFEVLEPAERRWVGDVPAGGDRTVIFTLRATSQPAGQATALVRTYASHDRVDVDEVTALVELAPKGGY
jgi:hypothetical protein